VTARRNAKPVLVFPGGMPRSLEYLRQCRRDAQPVVGASSLEHDVARGNYPSWRYLPYITQPGFSDALRQVILECDIGGVYTPNPVAWNHLQRVLKEVAPEVHLVNDSPVDVELGGYRAALDRARDALQRPLPLASRIPARPPLPEIEIAALFRHADLIPGMCDHEKMRALYEIARHSRSGDVVEIGSWWGKSAFVLARLARCFEIGNLLCVDPWTNEHLVQNDAAGLVDAGSAQMDAEEAHVIFAMNLLPYSARHVNYLRMPSTHAARHYRDDPRACTASFGTTQYRGSIAILHVDGNHSHAAARADLGSWSGMVVGGGWIVVDDYVWPYGDGPRRAGDEFLAANRDRIDVAFVMGSALFLQLSLAAGAPERRA
jgi:Methyltransferase domain